MWTRISTLFVVAAIALLFGAPAWSEVLYSNGPINGGLGAFSITAGYYYGVADSFTLTSSSTLAQFQAGLWVPSGDIPKSLYWQIYGSVNPNSPPTGSPIFDADNQTPTSQTYWGASTLNVAYGIFYSAFSLDDISLPAGNYWLVLDNGVTLFRSVIGWDQNNGPSAAYSVDFINDTWTNIVGEYFRDTQTYGGSEAFEIDGTGPGVAPIPEPCTMLFLGSGLIGLAGLWRKFKK